MASPMLRAAALEEQGAEQAAVTVFVFSDRAFVRDLILDFLQHHGFPQVLPCDTSVTSTLALPVAGALAIVDLGMEAHDPETLVRQIRLHRPGAAVIAIGKEAQLAALAWDPDGWIELGDPANRLATLARTVTPLGRRRHREPSIQVGRHLRVWRTLTARQRQILGLLACGVTNHKLAQALGITERTIKSHVAVLLEKFKADNRTELALIAARAGVRDKDYRPAFLS